ncbi:hypothetical protein JR316_0007819 [Psilocybe cubensis]|uniref:Uncharacterized protein n=2 Tax=Psilocybe cubensis TaxID=181762 RepID=A0A8H7XVG9_PSICU|nr:hypothetical protein JR316_0007819 [Psilocybe cubensis]KAH9479231.1 hypothetical protein JR316_0007819 [Psilocybe cubensis]
MTETPKKFVHWQFASPSLSNLNSPFFNTTNTSASSVDSTSSLEFINSQLVAHGYVPSPGLSLEGISNESCDRVVKCLLALLSQRMEDMSRTEELTAKVRTVTYDYERMVSMHRKAKEESANAEREMNMHKSRLTATLKTLQSTETAHKQTSAELQRTRTVLQGVRATHVAELKKKEKEVERILDKWQKISDAQAKLTAAPSGIVRCLNAAVVEGSEVFGKGQGYLEIALEQAEQARSSLSDDNLFLRKVLVRAVNELQSIIHHARCLIAGDHHNLEEPTPLTMTAVFPVAPPHAVNDRLNAIFKQLRESISSIAEISTKAPEITAQIPVGEVERLQGIITALKDELALTKKHSTAQPSATQAMFDKFAQDHRVVSGEIGEMSIELMSAPLQDEAKERLDALRKELDEERRRFTDAAVKFGKEKAALEAERFKFHEEKRSWQVAQMLAELPPTPLPTHPTHSPSPTNHPTKTKAPTCFSPKKSPAHKAASFKSPRKSPARKVPVGKAGSGRKAHRVSRRPSASPNAVAGAVRYETEYMPPLPALSLPPMGPIAPPLTSSLLPTSFVLPPPSPRASLPTNPALPLPTTTASSSANSPPESTTPDSDHSSSLPPQHRSTTPPGSDDSNNSSSPPPPPPLPQSSSSSSNLQIPATPHHPFPVAKPFALRMIHAYSPAKPSPLSRILMLGDSPLTPAPAHAPAMSLDELASPTAGSGLGSGSGSGSGSAPLDTVAEAEAEGAEDHGYRHGNNVLFPPPPSTTHEKQEKQISLAAELGVESPPDTPLQERNVPEPPALAPVQTRERVFFPFPDPNGNGNGNGNGKRGGYTGAEKGKSKAKANAKANAKAKADADHPPAGSRGTRSSAVGEKENANSRREKASSAPGSGGGGGVGVGGGGAKSGKISPLPPPPPPPGTTSTARKVSPTGGPTVKTSIKAVVKASTTTTTTASSVTMNRPKITTKPPGPPTAGTGPRRVPINSADAPPIGKGWKG